MIRIDVVMLVCDAVSILSPESHDNETRREMAWKAGVSRFRRPHRFVDLTMCAMSIVQLIRTPHTLDWLPNALFDVRPMSAMPRLNSHRLARGPLWRVGARDQRHVKEKRRLVWIRTS